MCQSRLITVLILLQKTGEQAESAETKNILDSGAKSEGGVLGLCDSRHTVKFLSLLTA